MLLRLLVFLYVRRLLGATDSVRSERQKQRGSGTSACRLVKEGEDRGRKVDGWQVLPLHNRGTRAREKS